MNASSDLDLAHTHKLLASPRISLLTTHPDAEVQRIAGLVTDHVRIDGRAALEEVLNRLAIAPLVATVAPKTLDLLGHATADGLLRLGDWTLDAENRTVTAFFRGIADVDLLPRIGVTAVRLLGCGTAATPRGRATLATLSELLGIEVLGTTGPIYNLHYDAAGFRDDARFLLAAAGDALKPAEDTTPLATQRSLDIDSLPEVALADRPAREWPRHLLGKDDARAVLELVDRSMGALMPGLLAIPSHELALPSSRAGHCYVAEVILDGGFVRVFPAGETQPGIVYPVSAPRRLLDLVRALPTV